MSGRDGWHIIDDGGALILCRHLPPRFDVAGDARVPAGRPVSRRAVAQQVRQDLWRALQRLRGFSPVVRVECDGSDVLIRAGGRIAQGRVPEQVRERIAALLDDPSRRARWIAHAGRKAA